MTMIADDTEPSIARPRAARQSWLNKIIRKEGVRGFALMSPTFFYALLLLAVPVFVVAYGF